MQARHLYPQIMQARRLRPQIGILKFIPHSADTYGKMSMECGSLLPHAGAMKIHKIIG